MTALFLPATLSCPECGAPMRRRDSRFGLFYGCSRYPACKSAHGCHPDGRPLTKTAQISLAGNSVCPQVAQALVEANVCRRSNVGAA